MDYRSLKRIFTSYMNSTNFVSVLSNTWQRTTEELKVLINLQYSDSSGRTYVNISIFIREVEDLADSRYEHGHVRYRLEDFDDISRETCMLLDFTRTEMSDTTRTEAMVSDLLPKLISIVGTLNTVADVAALVKSDRTRVGLVMKAARNALGLDSVSDSASKLS